MPRLFTLSSTFNVGSSLRTKYLLQEKQNQIASSVANGTSNPTVLERMRQRNNPTHWPKMVGLGGVNCSSTDPQYTNPCFGPCNCNNFCKSQNWSLGGTLVYENATGAVGCYCYGNIDVNFTSPELFGEQGSYGNGWSYWGSNGLVCCPSCPG